MKFKRTLVLNCFFLVLFYPFFINAWDKVEVHPILSEKSILKSILNNQYLEKNLGLKKGLNEPVNKKLLYDVLKIILPGPKIVTNVKHIA